MVGACERIFRIDRVSGDDSLKASESASRSKDAFDVSVLATFKLGLLNMSARAS